MIPRRPVCDFCQDRPWHLHNGVVDDNKPVQCPKCKRWNTEMTA